MTFPATLETSGGNATGVAVPEAVWHQLTPARRAAVTVAIGDYTYRSTVGFYPGAYMLPVSAANRSAAGLAAGDTVDITLELDTAPREVEVPAELAAAFEAEPAAKAGWESLAPGQQKAHATAITEAKTDATRHKRVAKVVLELVERQSRR